MASFLAALQGCLVGPSKKGGKPSFKFTGEMPDNVSFTADEIEAAVENVAASANASPIHKCGGFAVAGTDKYPAIHPTELPPSLGFGKAPQFVSALRVSSVIYNSATCFVPSEAGKGEPTKPTPCDTILEVPRKDFYYETNGKSYRGFPCATAFPKTDFSSSVASLTGVGATDNIGKAIKEMQQCFIEYATSRGRPTKKAEASGFIGLDHYIFSKIYRDATKFPDMESFLATIDPVNEAMLAHWPELTDPKQTARASIGNGRHAVESTEVRNGHVVHTGTFLFIDVNGNLIDPKIVCKELRPGAIIIDASRLKIRIPTEADKSAGMSSTVFMPLIILSNGPEDADWSKGLQTDHEPEEVVKTAPISFKRPAPAPAAEEPASKKAATMFSSGEESEGEESA